MRDAMADAHKGKKTIPERMEVFQRVFDVLAELSGKVPEMSLQPAFSSGSISFVTETADFSGEDLAKLKEVLDSCDTLEFYPENGFVKISVTVAELFTAAK